MLSKKPIAILLKIFLLLIATSCVEKIEEIKAIGKTPKLTDPSPPVNFSANSGDFEKPNPNSLWQPGSRSFFQDTRSRRVGDIVKVNIKFSNKAELSNETEVNRDPSTENFSFNTLMGLQNGIGSTGIPVPTAAAPLINLSSSNTNKGTGSISRSESVDVQVAAMVAEILPNGSLFLKASQEIRVNSEVREIHLTGIVRPDDIASDNSINMANIAEARISYGGRGDISRVQKPRYGKELLDVVLPW